MAKDIRLMAFHKRCMPNRNALSEAKICACFYCLEKFLYNQISDWTDDDDTALCPFCGIDAVLDFDTESADEELLRQMHSYRFERTIRLTANEWQEALRSDSWPPDLPTRKQQ